MLTEIEWWGGLVFIFMAFSFVMLYDGIRDEPKYQVTYLSVIVAYLSSAILLALYFYKLELMALQYAYSATFIIGLIATLIIKFWPETELMKAKEESDDDEATVGEVLLGDVIVFSPLIISLVLAGFKLTGEMNIVMLFL